jgi:hypothetical protein
MGNITPSPCRFPKHLHRGEMILFGFWTGIGRRHKPLNVLRINVFHLQMPEERNVVFTKMTFDRYLRGLLILGKH